MKKTILYVVGLPCSGKSLFLNRKYLEASVVSNDIITEEYAAEHNLTYNEALQILFKTDYARKECRKRFENFVKEQKNFIVIDNTNLTIKARRLYEAKGYEKHCVIFECSDEELQRRNIQRAKNGKFIPEHVYENMRKIYVEPTHKEGFVTIKKVRT